MVVLKPLGPHHLAIRSGSVNACHTSSRGASSSRWWTISRSAVGEAGLSFSLIACMTFLLVMLLLFQLAQIGVQPVQPLFPDVAIFFHPVGNALERPRFNAAGTPLRFASARDQPGALQD